MEVADGWLWAQAEGGTLFSVPPRCVCLFGLPPIAYFFVAFFAGFFAVFVAAFFVAIVYSP